MGAKFSFQPRPKSQSSMLSQPLSTPSQDQNYEDGLNLVRGIKRPDQISTYFTIIRMVQIIFGFSILKIRLVFFDLQFFLTMFGFCLIFWAFDDGLKKFLFLNYHTQKLDFPQLAKYIGQNHYFYNSVRILVLLTTFFYIIFDDYAFNKEIILDSSLFDQNLVTTLQIIFYSLIVVIFLADFSSRFNNFLSQAGFYSTIILTGLLIINFISLWDQGDLFPLKPFPKAELAFDLMFVKSCLMSLAQISVSFVFGVAISPIIGIMEHKNNYDQVKKVHKTTSNILFWLYVIMGLVVFASFGNGRIRTKNEFIDIFFAFTVILNVLIKYHFFLA